MDCASCKRSMEGCASIKCSSCPLQYHLGCVKSEKLTEGNSWRCGECEQARGGLLAPAPVVGTVRA